jgi:dihydrolipoamide dehydrogenase
MFSELSTAIVNRLTISQLVSVIRPHPTFTEGVTEAIEDAEGNAIHIAPRRKL